MWTRERLVLELLEDRTVPATFGMPWRDPGRLSLSFAPDGTAIAAHESSLFATLDPLTETVWQGEVLRAFQTWAVHANLNFHVRPDSGLPFGTAGLLQDDARFGDIRLGAQQMDEEFLAASVPHDPFISGTFAGDIFLNSDYAFTSADLLPILLHEAGHVLGLDHSDDPQSPMFAHLNRVTTLTAGDIADVRALYGARRTDQYEGSNDNDTFNRATQVSYPSQGQGSYTGATPLVLFGDITTARDIDIFALRPFSNYRGPVTLRLQTEGISLLAPRLTVFNASGQMLASAASANPSDVLIVQLGQVDPNATYYVQVQGSVTDIFGVGSYGLGITFDRNVQVPPDRLDMLLLGPHELLSVNDLANLGANPSALLNADAHTNDNFNRATRLSSSQGQGSSNQRTAAIASLEDATDVDVYSFRTPRFAGTSAVVLTVAVREFPTNGVPAVVELFQSNQTRQAAAILVNGNGTYTLQADAARADTDYYIRVQHPSGAGTAGNYGLTIHCGRTEADLELFADSELSPEQPAEAHALYVAHSQLFQFVLTETRRTSADVRVHMTIQDESGSTVLTRTVRGGETVTADGVFLTPGPYTVLFHSDTPEGGIPPGAAYQLRGRTIIDPIGPAIDDPTLTPMYRTPVPGQYRYPGDILSHNPFLWLFLGGV